MGQMLTAMLVGLAAASGTAIAQDGPPGRAMATMMRADTNADGAITRAEYQALADARFARRDANGNGTIDPGEEMRGRGMRGDGPPPPPPPPPPSVNMAAAPGAMPPPPFEVSTTREQARARAMERFDRIDANRDGRIDVDEMRASMPVRGQRPAPPPAD